MRKLTTLLLIIFSVNSFAQSDIQPGIYISEGGWGTLNITKDKNGITKFDIAAMGHNGYGCSIDGKIIKNISVVGDEPEVKCTVKFKETKNGNNVNPEGDGCRAYCGMQASFEGDYLKVAPRCFPTNIEKSRNEFKKLYKEKKYDEALVKLEPILNECSQTLFWIDTAWIRNDLAVTYAKLKKFDICEKVLIPLKEDADKDEEDLKNEYPPLEADMYWQIIKATKTNLKLCEVK
jgi:hypothetical protein